MAAVTAIADPADPVPVDCTCCGGLPCRQAACPSGQTLAATSLTLSVAGFGGYGPPATPGIMTPDGTYTLSLTPPAAAPAVGPNTINGYPLAAIPPPYYVYQTVSPGTGIWAAGTFVQTWLLGCNSLGTGLAMLMSGYYFLPGGEPGNFFDFYVLQIGTVSDSSPPTITSGGVTAASCAPPAMTAGEGQWYNTDRNYTGVAYYQNVPGHVAVTA